MSVMGESECNHRLASYMERIRWPRIEVIAAPSRDCQNLSASRLAGRHVFREDARRVTMGVHQLGGCVRESKTWQSPGLGTCRKA